ncbi:hypothetical protein H2248_008576 [Termitomyces sp. 'cryptogamus']|nr:hypothetical protein H2248_008576 [Termitomyces sp. 'cryptogamus']
MEFVDGTNLSDIWFDLGAENRVRRAPTRSTRGEDDVTVSFLANGSLCYALGITQKCRIRARRNSQQGTGTSAAVRPHRCCHSTASGGKSYQYQKHRQPRYLRIASSLVCKDKSLNYFRIRHSDLQETNIIVSRSSV